MNDDEKKAMRLGILEILAAAREKKHTAWTIRAALDEQDVHVLRSHVAAQLAADDQAGLVRVAGLNHQNLNLWEITEAGRQELAVLKATPAVYRDISGTLWVDVGDRELLALDQQALRVMRDKWLTRPLAEVEEKSGLLTLLVPQRPSLPVSADEALQRLFEASDRCIAARQGPESAAKSAEVECAGEQLALAARVLAEATDALPREQRPVGWEK